MDGLRWILLLAGVILVGVVYWLGKRREAKDQDLFAVANDVADPLLDEPRVRLHSPRQTQPVSPVAEVDDDDDLADVEPIFLPMDDELDVDDQIALSDKQQPVLDEELHHFSNDLQALNHILADTAPKQVSKVSLVGTRAKTKPTRVVAEELPEPPEKIIAIHVVARKGEQFAGADLLRVFTAHGYQFGPWDIFHAHHDGEALFSIANMVKPGSFDQLRMAEFSSPGISLFLRLPATLAANLALDHLLSEAKALSVELDGRLEDDTHSALTAQTIQHLRDSVRDYMHKYALQHA